MLEQLKEKLRSIFEANDVVLAYVFGSCAKNNIGPLSDFDVAIVFSKSVSGEEYFKKELQLAHEIGNVMKMDRVDVVNLITVKSPLLKHNAVVEAVPIFVKDENLRFFLERNIMKEYEDTKYLRAISYKILKEQIKNNTFGKGRLSPKEEKIFKKYVH